MSTPHFVSVTRALAMLSAVATAFTGCNTAREAYAQAVAPRPPAAPRACPSNLPTNNDSCAGFAPSQLCDFGYARCTCTVATPQSPPVWRCEYRSVPGPLPPPELV